MKARINNYTIFEANQVLTAEQLNNRFDYLDQQNRLSRTKLIGVGIVCGLEVSNPDPNTVFISPGIGITTDGYLICIENCTDDDQVDEDLHLTHYNTYTADFLEGDYPLFFNSDGAQYDMWELFPTPEAGDPDPPLPISSLSNFLADKVVLVFLECPIIDLKNCNPNTCENKGLEQQHILRKLLIRRSDAVEIIKRANGLEEEWGEGELVNYYEAQTSLSDLPLKRFNVPASALNRSSEVYEAFYELIGPDEVNPLANAIDVYQNVFQPLIGDLAEQADTSLLKSIFAGVHATPSIGIQYYYDFLNDLIAAFKELELCTLALITECNLCNDRFPRHLMLGNALEENQQEPSVFRNYFIGSPIHEKHLGNNRLKIRWLYIRLVQMISFFDPSRFVIDTEGDAALIKITPDEIGKAPLSERAIPYYYANNPTQALFRYWDPEKIRRNKERTHLSYHADAYSTQDWVLNPLNYDIESYNFLRIEGHIGQPIEVVERALKNYIQQFRLAVDVVSVGAGPVADRLLSKYVEKHPGIEHKAGVPKGGTLVLVYHAEETEVSVNPDPGQVPAGNVQFIHNSPDPFAASISIRAFQSQNFVSYEYRNLGFREATPFTFLAAGDYTLTVSLDNRPNTENRSFDLSIQQGERYVVIFGGTINPALGNRPFTPYVFNPAQLESASGNGIDVLFFQGNTQLTEVSVFVEGNELVDNISFGEYQGYFSLPGNDTRLAVNFNNSTNVFRANLANFSQTAAVIFMSGNARNLTNSGFSMQAALPDGSVVPFPIETQNPFSFSSAFTTAVPTNLFSGVSQAAFGFTTPVNFQKSVLINTLAGNRQLDIPINTVIADFYLPYLCCEDDACDLPCNGDVSTCDYRWFLDISNIRNDNDNANLAILISFDRFEIDGDPLISTSFPPFAITIGQLRSQGLQAFIKPLNALGKGIISFEDAQDGSFGLGTLRIQHPTCYEFTVSGSFSIPTFQNPFSGEFTFTQEGTGIIIRGFLDNPITEFIPKQNCVFTNECEPSTPPDTSCNLPSEGVVTTRDYTWGDRLGYIVNGNMSGPNYIMTIWNYEVNGISLVNENQPIVVQTSMDAIATNGFVAVAQTLNQRFPNGLVFSARPNNQRVSISHFAGHSFIFEWSPNDGFQANRNNRYTYTETTALIDGESGISSFFIDNEREINLCEEAGNIGNQDPYEWLHEHEELIDACDLPCGGVVETKRYSWADADWWIRDIEGSTYFITIWNYEVDGNALVNADQPITLNVPIPQSENASPLRNLATALNNTFPNGLLFAFDAELGLMINRFICHSFTLEWSNDRGAQALENARYTYTENDILRQNESLLGQLTGGSIFLEAVAETNLCDQASNLGNQNPYSWLHQNSGLVSDTIMNTNAPLPTSIEELQEWNAIVQQRIFSSFDQLPEKIQNRVTQVKMLILDQDPNAKIALSGSWIKGTWIDENTEERIKELKEKVLKKKPKLSDLDIQLETEGEVDVQKIYQQLDFQVEIYKVAISDKSMMLT